MRDPLNHGTEELALRFERAVEATLDRLSAHPQLGWDYRPSDPGLEGVRAFPVDELSRFLVFYRTLDSELRVERVLHGARDLQSLLTENEP